MLCFRPETRPRNGKNIEVMFNSAACSVHALFFLWHRWLKQSGWMIMNKLWKVFRLLVTSKAKRRVNLLWIFFTFHDFTFYSSFCCIQVAPFWCWILRVSFSLSTCVLLSSCYSHVTTLTLQYYNPWISQYFKKILRIRRAYHAQTTSKFASDTIWRYGWRQVSFGCMNRTVYIFHIFLFFEFKWCR